MFAENTANLAPVRVKICGITNASDAQAAIAAGADALGFNCYPQSKRFINLEHAHDWIANLAAPAKRIAVLVNVSRAEALAIARLPFIDGLQLHGQETPAFCSSLAESGVPFAKALPVSEAGLIDDASSFATQTIVLDSAVANLFGGSGKTFPWSVARRFVETHGGLRVILAGGLTPDNVALAVAEVRPFAVDVTTGVESSPGRKDHGRLREFIAAARSA